MEQRKDIVSRHIDQLVFQALDKLTECDEQVRKMEAELSAATESLEQDMPLDEKSRTIVNEYAAKLTILSGRHYRHLYLQGAKDCVALLRELGVIQ